jgi:hypothetical protein
MLAQREIEPPQSLVAAECEMEKIRLGRYRIGNCYAVLANIRADLEAASHLISRDIVGRRNDPAVLVLQSRLELAQRLYNELSRLQDKAA